jgi:hypothetical protein
LKLAVVRIILKDNLSRYLDIVRFDPILTGSTIEDFRMLTRSCSVAVLVSAILVSATLSGCGGGGVEDAPDVYPVKGKLTKGGSPIPEVTVEFIPTGKGISGTGTSADDGTFEIRGGSGHAGLPAGSYAVVLNKVVDMSAYESADGEDPTAGELPFPEEYQSSETSPSTVEVKAEPNEITINIE